MARRDNPRVDFPDSLQAFAFSHRLTRDAAYDALLASNRRKLHSAAADALARGLDIGAPDELPLLRRLIDHLSAAERWAEAHHRGCVLLLRRAVLGRTADWEALAAQVRELWERARAVDPALPPGSAPLCNAWALYLALTGRMDEARCAGEEALGLARAAGDRSQQAAALVHCGIATHYAGGQLAALDFYREALALYRAQDDLYGQLRCLNNIGLALHEAGRSEEALPYLETGLALAGNMHQIMRSNLGVNRGVVLHELKDYVAAQSCFEDALQAAREIGDRSTEGLALGNLGDLAGLRQEWELARRCLSQALGVAREVGSPRFVAWWINQRAELELRAGAAEEAWRFSLQAQAAAEASNDSVVLCHVLLTAALIAAERAHPAQAGQLLDRADVLAATIGYLSGERYQRVAGDLRGRIAADVPPAG
jgi:tetratricopeptide (TPR) repeat protein